MTVYRCYECDYDCQLVTTGEPDFCPCKKNPKWVDYNIIVHDKTCPFCGSARLCMGEENGMYANWCSDCCSYGPRCETRQEAVKRWNERTPYDGKNWDDLKE